MCAFKCLNHWNNSLRRADSSHGHLIRNISSQKFKHIYTMHTHAHDIIQFVFWMCEIILLKAKVLRLFAFRGFLGRANRFVWKWETILKLQHSIESATPGDPFKQAPNQRILNGKSMQKLDWIKGKWEFIAPFHIWMY